jgi:hypothetical protein
MVNSMDRSVMHQLPNTLRAPGPFVVIQAAEKLSHVSLELTPSIND